MSRQMFSIIKTILSFYDFPLVTHFTDIYCVSFLGEGSRVLRAKDTKLNETVPPPPGADRVAGNAFMDVNTRQLRTEEEMSVKRKRQ